MTLTSSRTSAGSPPAVAGGLPVRTDYLTFGRPALDEEAIADVVRTLRSGWIGTGPKTVQFEVALAGYLGVAHVIAVNSCTSALHLSLVAAGIGPGDDVIVPAMTFVATANAVVHAGARPVLCDVDEATQVMTPAHLAATVTPRTKAIVPVHFAGRPADLAGIVGFAEARGAIVVSDAAHAIEARQAGRGIATLAPLTAYSFYPTKNITTGEGGAIATDDAHLAERLRVLRLHGLSADAWQRYSDAGTKHYEAIEVGFKANMTDMQASLGLSQLAKIEAWSRRRTEIWERYDAAFADVPATTPSGWPAGDRHARHLYTLGLELDRLRVDRDDVAHALHLEGIGTGVHYRGVHLQPAYRARLGVRPGDFPASSRISERTLSIPLGPALDDDDVSDVIAAVTRVLAYYTR